jgi:hypothetical protein
MLTFAKILQKLKIVTELFSKNTNKMEDKKIALIENICEIVK